MDMACMDIFLQYFEKHYPQWRGRVTPESRALLETFLCDLTGRSDLKEAWMTLEANLVLMMLFQDYAKGIFAEQAPCHRQSIVVLACVWVAGLVAILGLGHHVPPELITTLSMIIGGLGVSLKKRCLDYLNHLYRTRTPRD